MSWYKKAISLNRYEYKIPSDPKELLYDFYIVSSFPKIQPHERNSEVLNLITDDVKKKLYPHLKKHLLNAVFLSISYEIRHIFEYCDYGVAVYHSYNDKINHHDEYDSKENIEKKTLNKYENKYNTKENEGPLFDSVKYFLDHYVSFKRISEHGSPLIKEELKKQDYIKNRMDQMGEDYSSNLYEREGQRSRSLLNIHMIMEQSGANKLDVIKIAKFCFDNFEWDEQFGGTEWGKICSGWINLNSSNDINDMQVWIDHMYSLQHNNGTVFNKLKSYYKNGYEWILSALDEKFESRSPYELLHGASDNIKYIAPYIYRQGGYGTQEIELEKSQQAKLKQILDFIERIEKDNGNSPRDAIDNIFYHEDINEYVRDSKVQDIYKKEFFEKLFLLYYKFIEDMRMIGSESVFGINIFTGIQDTEVLKQFASYIENNHDKKLKLIKLFNEKAIQSASGPFFNSTHLQHLSPYLLEENSFGQYFDNTFLSSPRSKHEGMKDLVNLKKEISMNQHGEVQKILDKKFNAANFSSSFLEEFSEALFSVYSLSGQFYVLNNMKENYKKEIISFLKNNEKIFTLKVNSKIKQTKRMSSSYISEILHETIFLFNHFYQIKIDEIREIGIKALNVNLEEIIDSKNRSIFLSNAAFMFITNQLKISNKIFNKIYINPSDFKGIIQTGMSVFEEVFQIEYNKLLQELLNNKNISDVNRKKLYNLVSNFKEHCIFYLKDFIKTSINNELKSRGEVGLNPSLFEDTLHKGTKIENNALYDPQNQWLHNKEKERTSMKNSNWYKKSNVNPGKYIIGINGELFPCVKEFKDCLPWVVNYYNILVENQDSNSKEYQLEVMNNGLALLTVIPGRDPDVKSTVPLNGQQQGTVNKIFRQRLKNLKN